MTEIISICNQKGGVGKTTTSVNLAACLAAAEKKTLLIDMDAQGNATTGLGFNKREISPNIYDVLLEGEDIKNSFKETEIPFLKIIGSSTDLVGAEIGIAQSEHREKLLKNILSSIKDEFDYILIDCPPSLGMITLNALVASDSVIIPVQCEYYAMEGMADLNRTISVIRERANSELQIKGILLTMFDKRNKIAHEVSNEIRSHFPNSVFDSVIPRSVRLSEAPSFGKPIILYDVKSSGAESYLSLAQEVMMNGLANSEKLTEKNEANTNDVDTYSYPVTQSGV